MVPLKLLRGKKSADYVNTGMWAKKAIDEAKRFCAGNVAASSEASKFTSVPAQTEWKLSGDAAYVHYTPNETIGGVEFHWAPDTGDVPLVADMSSALRPPPRRSCSITRPTPTAVRCTTLRPPTAGIWPAWCFNC